MRVLSRRDLLAFGLAGIGASFGPVSWRSAEAQEAPEPWAAKLVAAAEAQVGETVVYDGSYVRLSYPGGDVPRERGVCTDVIVRAYRDAFGIDLQKLIHEDMSRAFAAYPRKWGLARPDRNIDHRRVPNLETFFARANARLAVSTRPEDYKPGDIVSQLLPGRLAHIGIVAYRRSADGDRLLLVHNIGAGTQVEDVLFRFEITGHFRYPPPESG